MARYTRALIILFKFVVSIEIGLALGGLSFVFYHSNFAKKYLWLQLVKMHAFIERYATLQQITLWRIVGQFKASKVAIIIQLLHVDDSIRKTPITPKLSDAQNFN